MLRWSPTTSEAMRHTAAQDTCVSSIAIEQLPSQGYPTFARTLNLKVGTS